MRVDLLSYVLLKLAMMRWWHISCSSELCQVTHRIWYATNVKVDYIYIPNILLLSFLSVLPYMIIL